MTCTIPVGPGLQPAPVHTSLLHPLPVHVRPVDLASVAQVNGRSQRHEAMKPIYHHLVVIKVQQLLLNALHQTGVSRDKVQEIHQ